MKRFYREVSTAEEPNGRSVLLDRKPLRTPAQRLLLLPTPALAAIVAEEWRAQPDVIRPADMPLTRLATTVVDLMPDRRDDAVAEVTGYAGTDLLCYRAGSPAELVARQQRTWQPWLDWAQQQLDARLRVTDTIEPIDQPANSLKALAREVERLDVWRLVGLHAATILTGSIVLGLAIERGVLGAQQALPVALLEELYEIELWGDDPEKAQRHARLGRDLDAAGRYLASLSSAT